MPKEESVLNKELLNIMNRFVSPQDTATEVLKLLSMGADVNVKRTDGTTLFMWAVTKDEKFDYLVKLLIEDAKEYNIDANAKNNDGESVLMAAVRYRPDNALLLLDNAEKLGIDVNLRDPSSFTQGNTALDYAIFRGSLIVLKWGWGLEAKKLYDKIVEKLRELGGKTKRELDKSST